MQPASSPTATLLLSLIVALPIPNVMASPVPNPLPNPTAAALDPRQTGSTVMYGTCTVATNLCLLDYTIGYPGATANYTCGRYITFGGSFDNAAKRCFEDGHACTTTLFGFSAASTVCN